MPLPANLEVVEVGFGEELLTRSSSPILPSLNVKWYEHLRQPDFTAAPQDSRRAGNISGNFVTGCTVLSK